MGVAAARLTPERSSSAQRAQKRHSSCMPSQTGEYSQGVDTRSFRTGNKSMNQPSRHNTHSCGQSIKLQSGDSVSSGSVSGSPSDNNITRPNYKTEFCSKFRESGSCPFGDRCQFVHHEHELQRRNRALTYKTRPCWSGTDCPYQQNHARCIYLHGDETAEMFDQQRGISFAKVQKILANKELKQNRQRHHPKTTATASEELSTIGTADSESVWSYFPYGSRFTKSMDNILVVASAFSSTQPDTAVAAAAAATAITTANSTMSTVTAPIKPLRTPKILMIIPALPFSSLSEPEPLAGTVSTLQTMPELFSPGVMPTIDIPFSSHDLINDWKDPCFEEEDNSTRNQLGGHHHHRHLQSRPTAAQLEHKYLDTIITEIDAKVVGECKPRQQENLQVQSQKPRQDQPTPVMSNKNHIESTGLFSGIKAKKNSMAFANQLSSALRWGSSNGTGTSSSTTSPGHSGSHYRLW
ncbi:hypothetical protein BGZ51_003121 [Haplosporangium sp. Z 767]|nr:hypothetical protein BGZ51_003121 [Haplosporangium sp. Z 767]KAF9191435.1 hypothetical protein BGZ50_009390 [Haplosporangium sp. Z 11]